MYGKSRKFKFSRLTSSVNKGDKEFVIAPGLEIVKGDLLAIAPTGYFFEASDEVIVDSYDNTTGKVTIVKGLDTYHFGSPLSTGSKYNGVDIRAEVALLSRNIRIVG